MTTAPLLVQFSKEEDFLKVASQGLNDDELRAIRILVAKGLPPVTSIQCVAVLFGISPRFISSMIHYPVRYYRVFKIRKGKSFRTVCAPVVALKLIQRWIGHHLALAHEVPTCCYGFVPGRSVPMAAQVHIGSEWVYGFDIENFFGNVSPAMVSSALCGIGYSNSAAELISSLCCFKESLPQGSPASPVLSNLVLGNFDALMVEYATIHKLKYTRYADDLNFSGVGSVPDDLSEFVEKALAALDLKLAHQKVKLLSKSNRLKVHGLLVQGSKVRLTKGYRKKIRLYRHLLLNGNISAEERFRMMGHLSYADFIQRFGDQSTKLN